MRCIVSTVFATSRWLGVVVLISQFHGISAFALEGGVRVTGPGTLPRLGFACCDRGIEEAQSLFADGRVIAALQELHAEVAVPTLDFTVERAQIVRTLNRAGIPVIAWILLPEKEGFYLNADNAPQAEARFTGFEAWTREYGLQWARVGLDIEPNFAELGRLREHWWRLAPALVEWSLDEGRIDRARIEYSALIRMIQSAGYRVQTYQMPFVVAERREHSTAIDRLLGTVEVRGNDDYLMLYTSYAPRSVGAGMIWELGPYSQAIAIGSTAGNATPGSYGAPLNWMEFSRDLIVASHFTRSIGVYDLEGCVRQGFLTRLTAMDWGQTVFIPAGSIERASRMARALRIALWIGTRIWYLVCLMLLLVAWLVWRGRLRRGRTIEKCGVHGEG